MHHDETVSPSGRQKFEIVSTRTPARAADDRDLQWLMPITFNVIKIHKLCTADS